MEIELNKLETNSIHNINHNNSTITQVNQEHLSFWKLSTNWLQKKDVPPNHRLSIALNLSTIEATPKLRL
jgi:hypothetical protein